MMADSVTMKIDGLKELADKLRAMGPDIEKKALRASVMAAAKIVRDDAKANNLDDTGTTDRALYAKYIKEESAENKATYFVGVRSGKKERKAKRDAFYWRFIEFGTAKLSAHPFMRPAFEKNKMKLVEAIADKISARIKRFEKSGR